MRLLLTLAILSLLPSVYAETEEQTVSRCIEDIRSGELARRRRAAMVIGKYSSPAAIEAVLLCLKDADSQVRQSALVSLTEDHSLPPEARMPVMRMLQDGNVHIRRLASSMLPDCMGVRMRGHARFPGNMHVTAGGSRSAEEIEEASRLVNLALKDQDPSVRLNVLNASFCYPFPLEQSALEAFFGDESELVRIMAVRAYFYPRPDMAPSEAALRRLAKDKAAAVRTELAKGAQVLGVKAEKLLVALSDDEAAQVALAALETCARMQLPSGLERISVGISGERFNAAEKVQLCRALRHYGAAARLVLDKAMETGGPLGEEALSMVLEGGFGPVSMDMAMKGLEAGSFDVRRRSLFFLRGKAADLKDDVLQAMLRSRHAEVRLALVDMLRMRPATESRGELALDLCADEDARVRGTALRLLSTIRPEGWTDVLMTALQEEESRELRDAAAMALCSAPKEEGIVAALRAYRPLASPIIARRIENYVRQWENAKGGAHPARQMKKGE